jgi:outer membrane protein OmpA-like peptidoglycan-associated protein
MNCQNFILKNFTLKMVLAGALAGVCAPAQQSFDPHPEIPVFRVTAVSRSIQAINYHHRQGSTVLGFQGTALAPKAKGEARVDSKTGATKVEARFEKLPPPQDFGPEYLTYVLWAITPEGRATNMGEVYGNDDQAKLLATSELQAFGMIVTAEPYYAVTQPSDMIVMENRPVSKADGSTTGTFSPIDAKYELLEKGAYVQALPAAERNLTKQDKSDSPLDLKQARHAMAIASSFGARTYAADTMKKADVELMNAEAFWKSSKDKKRVQTLARNVTQLAEDARLIAVKRKNEEVLEAERRAKEAQITAANTAAEQEAMRRQAAEQERQRAEQEREAARLRATEASLAAQNALAQAEAQRAAAEAARLQAEQAKLEAERARLSVLESQKQLEAQRAESAALVAEQKRLAEAAENARAQAEAEKMRLREELRNQFNMILETRDTARGLIVNMSDVLFDTGKYTLRPAAREKLARISGIVQAHPGLKLAVEGHTDSVGSDDLNQRLSERRAETVRDYLLKQGLPSDAITAKGFGESQPIADNNTASGRQQNRRVEMVVSGDIIERTITLSKTSN